MYLYIIIGLLIAIVVVTFRKNQSKEHLENCNLNINNTNSNGRKTFFTNFMLDEYLNKNGRIDRLKENNIETKTTLANYKQNVFDGNSEYNRLNTEYNLFNNNMDTQFNKSNAALQNKINETKNLKQSAVDKFNRIDNKMINVVGNPESSLETKLKSFVDASINSNLDKVRDQTINNINSDTLFNNRMSQLAGDINNWKIIPGYGCPMRVDPNSGDIQCLSYDGKNCEWNFVNQNGSDLTKINNYSVKPLSCGADHKSKYNSEGYNTANHWCKGVYDYLAKNFITQVDWTNCPVGWNIDQNGTLCQAPNDYKGPCSKTSGFSNYSNESKQSWAASCTSRWPFKLNLNSTVNNLGKISSVIDKEIANKIGRIVPRTELDNVNTYNNGVYVQVYKLGPNNSRGDKLQDGIITTNINFNWGVGLIFGIRENNNQTNTETIYLEMTGFLKTPANVSNLKFRLTSDDGSRLIFSNTVEISNMSIVIDLWKSPGTSKESSSIVVTPKQYLPFQLQFYENYGAANLKLEWSINGSAFSVIPRESFFVNKEICNYQFNFKFVKEIDTRAQSMIPKITPLFTISNPRIPLLSVPNFPFLGLMPNWEMNINFNVNGRQNSWRAIIGDMYNPVNTGRGWGVWITPSNNNIHFSWQSITWNAEPAFNILPNINYNLKITRNPTSLTLLLTNLNTNISQTSTNNSISQYVMTTNGPVTIGGWINYSGENFPGTISNINVIGNKREYLLGIGTDTKLWYMPADFSRGWTQVGQNNCCVTSMSQMNDGTLLGVGTNKCLYTKSSINGDWNQVDCQQVKSAIQLKDGTLLGVNMENKLWTKTKFTDNWSLVAQNNCCVVSIIQLNDGTLLGVGTDNNIYTKQNLNGGWSQVSGGCCVKSITQLQNGTFVGVGTDNNLWYKSSLTAPWEKKGNCCVINVVSIMM